MRPILPGDLDAATRVVLRLPPALRPVVIDRLLAEAELADRYRQRTGRLHPLHGNGSLSAAAGRWPQAPLPAALSIAAARALIAVLEGWLRWRGARDPFRLGCGTPSGLESEGVAETECTMAIPRPSVAELDPVWHRIREEADAAIRAEPLMGGLIHSGVLHHPSFERALAYRLSFKLASPEMSEQILREIADAAHAADPSLGQAARADIVATFERDPACHRYLQPLLFFKGFQAVQAYRLGHWLWQTGRRDLAYFIQMRVSEVFGVDIHPAARIGRGIMIDHAHSIVIGETAVVGDNVSMLHSVTLGGTGKEHGDRHPKIGHGVLIGAGAKVLGNITIGACSRIAAGSVVLADVPPCKTVAGVPARIVGEAGCDQPAVAMDQQLKGCVDCG
jgi:serine O-acetyltransferase